MQGYSHNLIRPKGFVPEAETLSPTYGKFVCEPLERGFGLTLGNALRRVLLSSISGAAITQVQFEGILHEFSTIPDVVEDVTQIILNLKACSLKMEGDERREVTAVIKGECEVLAKDLFTTPGVEATEPNHHIATLGPDGVLNIRMVVQKGYGYKPAERNKDPNAPLGTIFLDAMFTPIRRVAYRVSQARVGQHTDYDRLTMEVWTNGAISPEDAIKAAATILRDQFAVFAAKEEIPVMPEKTHTQPKEASKTGPGGLPWEILYRPIEELDLSVRAQNCLQHAGLRYVGELVQKTDQEMMKTRNFGRKSLKEIKDVLADMGLSLGMQIEGFDPDRKPM